MTILELLVVMLILLMVTAAAIPIVSPAMQNRRMRESGRLVSSYFASARSRAIETGRPVGVVIERFNGQPFAFQLSQVEVPPPYSGETVASGCQVAVTGPPATAGETAATPESQAEFNNRFNSSGHTAAAVWFAATFVPADINPSLVRVGDQIRLGHKGPTYSIWGPDISPTDGVIDSTATTLDIAYQYPSPTPYTRSLIPPDPPIDAVYFPWENTPPPPATSFQIIRQPTRSSTAPLQLPEGIVIDLVSSGMGISGTFMSTASFGGVMTPNPPTAGPIVLFDPVIMFSPSGRLESVSQGTAGIPARPTDAVYLLLGRRELMYDVTQKGADSSDAVDQNLSPIPNPSTVQPEPPAHFWVSIGYQTGLVTVSEVAANFQDYTPATAKPLTEVITDALGPARLFARQSQSVGGR